MAENHNEVNPTITINVPGTTPGAMTIEQVVAWMSQVDLTLKGIRNLVENNSQLTLSGDLTQIIERTNEALTERLVKIEKNINKKLKAQEKKIESSNNVEELKAEIEKLREMLDVVHPQAEGQPAPVGDSKFDDIMFAITKLTERVDSLEKGLKTSATPAPASVEPQPVENAPQPQTEPTTPTPNAEQNTEAQPEPENTEVESIEPTSEEGGNPENEEPTNNVEPEPTSAPVAPVPTPVTTSDPEPKPEPTPITTSEPTNARKYKKAKFLSKSIQETAILAEPKRPWYKRLAKFTINHPILTALAGAGIGLGVVGAAVGITAAAGITGMLSMANFFFPSLVIGSGLGAIGGGALSLVSRVLPGSKKERLYTKFSKQYKKCMNIDKAKDLFSTIEENAKNAKQKAREKHRNSKGLLKTLKVYRIAKNYHRFVEKLGRKGKRYMASKFVPAVDKAVSTKAKLNIEEIKSGKTMAVAGYIQKKKKLEAKYIAGKIGKEDFEADMQDLEEDVVDLKGGEKGLSKTTGQLAYDKEAMTLIDKVKEDQRSKSMDVMVSNIKKRNSKTKIDVAERIYQDPDQVAEEIAELRKQGRDDEADSLQVELDDLIAKRKEYEDWAEVNGVEAEGPVDATEQEFEDSFNQ